MGHGTGRMREPARGLIPTGSFLPLLVSLVALLLVDALLEDFVETRIAFSVLFSAVLLAALVPIVDERRLLYVGIGLALPTVALTWLRLASDSWSLPAAGYAVGLVFTLFIVGVVLRAMLRRGHVSYDTIRGGVCGYLLLGVFWAQVFGLVEVLAPGSVADAGAPIAGDASPTSTLLYYALVTMSTLGYGDVLPQTAFARALASLAAITGQLYVAILIAALVGRWVAERGPGDA